MDIQMGTGLVTPKPRIEDQAMNVLVVFGGIGRIAKWRRSRRSRKQYVYVDISSRKCIKMLKTDFF